MGRWKPLCVVLIGVLSGCQAPAREADLVLLNARIWTGDTLQPWAEALAVRDGRLLAVGTNADIRRHQTTHTAVLDGQGRLVTPGFTDDHTHFAQAGALLLGVNLLAVSTPTPLVDRVRAVRDHLPDSAWITGGDWGAYEDWASGSTGDSGAAQPTTPRFAPDRTLIDSITPTTPVLLRRWDRSTYLANGVALAAANLSCNQRVPGLECLQGTPTGRITGEALRRIQEIIPPKKFGQRIREAKTALAHLNALGVTGIHDITAPEQLPVYQALNQEGSLTVRINARPTLDKWSHLAAVGIPQGFGDDWLRIGGLKGFVDGIQGNSTARFYEPQLHSGERGTWRDSTNTGATSGPGSGMEPAGTMESNLLGADRAGYWPQVHAIGDQAIDTLLDLYEKVMRDNPTRERRFRIIHSQVLRGSDVAERLARLGIIAEVQPYHAIDDMRWMEERIGERARWAYAFRTLELAGVTLIFGSDWPGTNASWYTADPMKGIYAAVTRQTLDGNPEGGWFPEERVSLETALRAYTVNSAWAAGQEEVLGTLSAGRLADFVILDQDLFTIPPTEIKNVQALVTVVGGRVVFDRDTVNMHPAPNARRE